MTSQYKNLDDFLSKHKFNKTSNVLQNPTHTRIGDKTQGVIGGSYLIPDDEKGVFYELYYKKVFQDKRPEYLTEKQCEKGPILIDFDFKFSLDVDSRLYTNDHLMDILTVYLETLKNMIQFTDTPFHAFILEKKDVNRCVEKGLTKDGIHIIIGIQMDHIMQVMLRKRVLQELPQMWDEDGETPPLPITNSWENIVDDTICKGTTNWQLYGSRKPGHEAYGLTNHFVITFDEADKQFSLDKKNIKNAEKELLHIISAQYTEHPAFPMKQELQAEYDQNKTPQKPKKKSCIRFKIIDEDETPNLEDIKTHEQLVKAVNNIFRNLGSSEYWMQEIHEYTQILPASYYEDGSHLKNRQVAFALKHTDDRMFLSWVMLRAKNPTFDYGEIPELFRQWNTYFNKETTTNLLTKNSIIYWAKNDAPLDKFLEVKNSSLNHYIDETLSTSTATDYDIAKVLYHMNKHTHCCVNIGMKTWYVFENHRWKEDKSMSIRNKISEEVYQLYFEKQQLIVNEMQDVNAEDADRHSYLTEQLKKVNSTCIKVKRTSDKNNIFRESMEIFYNDNFSRKTDANKYLMCFSNGVVDIKAKTFRAGVPEDYITKCTNNEYFQDIAEYTRVAKRLMEEPDFDYGDMKKEILTMIIEIYEYMNQLYPAPGLCDYMWAHLASCLIGENINQTCSFYIGSGSNGKSCIVELMSYAFGDYKGVLPISIVTEKRAGIGGTTSELIALKGVRYAVMQESSKGMRINEGILKELTGGDAIVGRQLFKESETFTPQFTLVVCTNNLPEVDATDDGTWRRIKSIPHQAKFVDNLQDERYASCPYLFKKDKNVKDKLQKWAPIFMSMLVQKVFETEGFVEDCEEIAKHSNQYRESQDYISAFIREMIVKEPGAVLKQLELTEEFKRWFQENHGGSGTKIPKGSEVKTAITNRFWEMENKKWVGLKINTQYVDDMNTL